MQNQLYVIFSLIDDWFAVSPQEAIMESKTHAFCEFRRTPIKDWTPRKVQNSGQERMWTTEMNMKCFDPVANPHS